MALAALPAETGGDIVLMTTVTDEYDRVTMHGVRVGLVRAQADALGLRLVEVRIPAGCSNDVYERAMGEALGSPPLEAAHVVAFGDLFLSDIRRYREERLARIGRRAVFPLWGRDTRSLAREFVDRGFRAILTCVDPGQLDPGFVGRRFDHGLLAELPPGVDPCGENGEFHTFVYSGPIFRRPLSIRRGRIESRGGFAFCDLTLRGRTGTRARVGARTGSAVRGGVRR